MARHVVTGATGFVGGRVADRLRARGDDVVAFSRRPAPALEERGIEVVVGDLTDQAAARAAVDGADGVVHAAAASGPDLDTARQVNRDGTATLSAAAADAAVAGFVHVSTTSVYDLRAVGDREVTEDDPLVAEPDDPADEPPSVYALTKAEAEAALQPAIARGLTVTVLRPPAVLGAGETSTWGTRIPRRFRDGELPARAPATTFGWVHVEDLVDAVLAALDDPVAAVCNVVGGHADFGRYLGALRTFVPEAPATAAATDDRPWRGRYATTALSRVLGVTPQRTFDEAMEEIAAAWH